MENALMKSPNGATRVSFVAVTAQVCAVTATYGANFASERSVTSFEWSRAMANFSVEALFKAAFTKKFGRWLQAVGGGRKLRRRGHRPMSARRAVDEAGRLW